MYEVNPTELWNLSYNNWWGCPVLYPELTADLMEPEESLRLICVAFRFSMSREADSKVFDLRL